MTDCVDQVARTMATFHNNARRGPDIDADGSSDAIGRLWRRNLSELEVAGDRLLPRHAITDAKELGLRYVAGRQEVFASRIQQRRIVDGHGDLLADDVFCLDDGPRLLDCLEFDPSLRHVDSLLDMAALASDLEQQGRPDLGHRLLESYRSASGDSWPSSLEHFYIAHRALVRAKVACLVDPGGSGESVALAAALLAQARRHLQTGTVRLVLVGGLPGTGKSTLVAALSRVTGWHLLRTDVVRKERSRGDRPVTGGQPSYGAGRYDPKHTAAVYSQLLSRAAAHLRGGNSVVLDATWSNQARRDAAVYTASQAQAELRGIWCKAPGAVAARRLAERTGEGNDPSDATADIAEQMARDFDPWPDAVPVDGTRSVDEMVQTALQGLGYPLQPRPSE